MLYTVNPHCPYCGEEHGYCEIELSADEENELLELNKDLENKNLNELGKLLYQKPVIVTRSFRCPVCGHVCESAVPVYMSNRIDFISPESVGVGRYKV